LIAAGIRPATAARSRGGGAARDVDAARAGGLVGAAGLDRGDWRWRPFTPGTAEVDLAAARRGGQPGSGGSWRLAGAARPPRPPRYSLDRGGHLAHAGSARQGERTGVAQHRGQRLDDHPCGRDVIPLSAVCCSGPASVKMSTLASAAGRWGSSGRPGCARRSAPRALNQKSVLGLLQARWADCPGGLLDVQALGQ